MTLRYKDSPSLVIKGKRPLLICRTVTFIPGTANEAVSVTKQFEAHCRKAHPKREHELANSNGPSLRVPKQ